MSKERTRDETRQTNAPSEFLHDSLRASMQIETALESWSVVYNSERAGRKTVDSEKAERSGKRTFASSTSLSIGAQPPIPQISSSMLFPGATTTSPINSPRPFLIPFAVSSFGIAPLRTTTSTSGSFSRPMQGSTDLRLSAEKARMREDLKGESEMRSAISEGRRGSQKKKPTRRQLLRP